jgi:hypothetical protein
VLGVFSEAGSLLLGLCNFLMPLRASNIPRDELLPIVIVGSKDFIGREWHMLKNFPEVYVKDVGLSSFCNFKLQEVIFTKRDS